MSDDDDFNCNTDIIIMGTYNQLKQILLYEFHSILKKNFKLICFREKAMRIKIKSIYELNHSLSHLKLINIYNKYDNIRIFSSWSSYSIGCEGIFIAQHNKIIKKEWYIALDSDWRNIDMEVCDIPKIVLADSETDSEGIIIEPPSIPTKKD